MGVKVKHTTKHDGIPGMIKNMKLVKGSGVEVGVLKGEHAWLAGIHEYGCTMTVTNKQRRFMKARYGILLGKKLTIPERSFLRAGYDANRDKVMRKAQMVLKDVASGKTTARGCYQAVGIELRDRIKDYAVDLSSPPNSSFTVGQKGSSNPLVASGEMIDGITWRKA